MIEEFILQDIRYTMKLEEKFPEPSYTNLLKEVFYKEYSGFDPKKYLSASERRHVKELDSQLDQRFSLRLALYNEKELVGWTYGWQESEGVFYMSNSAIVMKHRRKGLYSKLLEMIIGITNDMGFQTLYSKHLMSNNPVIIAKLKAGFHITGIEMSEDFGSMLKMAYFNSLQKKKFYLFRTGALKPDKDLLHFLS